MKWIVALVSATLIRNLRRPGTWLMALALLFTAFPVRFVAGQPQSAAPVQVGVALSDDSGQALWDALSQRSGTVVEFILTDAETLKARVAGSQWDCGILTTENFESRLTSGDPRGCVQLITGPGSTVYPVVQETAAACLAELSAPAIADAYCKNNDIQLTDAADSLKALPPEERVLIQMQTLDGAPLSPLSLASGQTMQIFRVLLGLMLLGWTLYQACDLNRWAQSPWGRRLSSIQNVVLFPQALAGILPQVLGAAGALLLAGDGPFCIASLAGFAVCLCGLTSLIAGIPGISELLPVLVPFLLPAAVLCTPHAAELLPLPEWCVRMTRLLPLSLFEMGCTGNRFSLVFLWILAAGFLVLIPCFRGRKSVSHQK